MFSRIKVLEQREGYWISKEECLLPKDSTHSAKSSPMCPSTDWTPSLALDTSLLDASARLGYAGQRARERRQYCRGGTRARTRDRGWLQS